MRTVGGFVVIVALLCASQIANAQDDGWGNQPQDTGTTSDGWDSSQGSGNTGTQAQEGWGQQTDPETPTNTGSSGTSWGQQQQQQTNQQQTSTTQQSSTTQTSDTTEESSGPVGSAFRMQHKVSLGAHTHMSGAFLAAFDGLAFGYEHENSPWLNVSLMLALNPRLALDIFIGFTVGTVSMPDIEGVHENGDKVSNFQMGIGPRLLITLSEGDHARLYTGAGLALIIGRLNSVANSDDAESNCVGDCGGWDSYGFAMGIPVGVEYRFRRVPNLAMSVEVNFHLVFQSVGDRRPDDDDPRQDEIVSYPAYNQVIVGLGNPRFDGSMSVIDYFTFVTFGFHYSI